MYVQLDGWEFARPHEAMPKARQYANKALSLDPALAEAYVSLAAIYETYDWQPEATGRTYARAVALDPGYITAHWWYAAWLDAAGRGAEARQEWNRALQLDPLSIPVLTDVALWSFAREPDRQLETDLSLCRRAIDIDPANSLAYRCAAHLLGASGRQQEAAAAIEKAVDLAPDYPAVLSDLAEFRARAGDLAEARQILNRLLSMASQKYVPAFVIARVFYALGDRQRTLDWLEKAWAERSPRLGWYLIRKEKYIGYGYGSGIDPGFTALVRQVLSAQRN